jgi:hypothetical protein
MKNVKSSAAFFLDIPICLQSGIAGSSAYNRIGVYPTFYVKAEGDPSIKIM